MNSSMDDSPPSEFHYFMQLPVHIKVDIMSRCESSRTMMNLAETCTEMYRLLITTPRLMSHLKLVIKFSNNDIQVMDELTTILKNASIGRRYKKIKLMHTNEVSDVVKPLMMTILKIVGTSVVDLEVALSTFVGGDDLTQILRCFNNVEKLKFSKLHLDGSGYCDVVGMLPNLKELLMQDSDSKLLRLFERFTTLRRFKFHMHSRGLEPFCYGISNFEDFILQQRDLKVLDLSRMHRNCLFQQSSFDDMKTKLESISANRIFVHSKKAASFFAKQQNLKSIKLFDFYDSRIFSNIADYCGVLKSIFSLPQLESVGIFGQTVFLEDFEFLGDVVNPSVKSLEYDMWNITVLEKFMKMFPNLKSISFRCFTVKLRNVPCDKLSIMGTSGAYNLEEFSYQPTNFDRDDFEPTLKRFLLRNKTIKHLTIGHSSWVKNDFKLSLNFWIEVFYHLPDLSEVVIYNPSQLKLLVMLMLRNRNALKSATIYTNAEGKAATQGMEEKWLRIVEV